MGSGLHDKKGVSFSFLIPSSLCCRVSKWTHGVRLYLYIHLARDNPTPLCALRFLKRLMTFHPHLPTDLNCHSAFMSNFNNLAAFFHRMPSNSSGLTMALSSNSCNHRSPSSLLAKG